MTNRFRLMPLLLYLPTPRTMPTTTQPSGDGSKSQRLLSTLHNADQATASFEAPVVDETLRFSITATDDTGLADTDNVKIQVFTDDVSDHIVGSSNASGNSVGIINGGDNYNEFGEFGLLDNNLIGDLLEQPMISCEVMNNDNDSLVTAEADGENQVGAKKQCRSYRPYRNRESGSRPINIRQWWQHYLRPRPRPKPEEPENPDEAEYERTIRQAINHNTQAFQILRDMMQLP